MVKANNKSGEGGDRSEECWVVGSNPDLAIRARSVTAYLENGGAVKEVRIVESDEGDWSLFLRLAGRNGEFRLSKWRTDEPKLFKDVALAVAWCRDDFHYFGPIVLSTERLPLNADPAQHPPPDLTEPSGKRRSRGGA